MTGKIQTEYQAILKSGMLWEFFPDYTGVWEKDKVRFTRYYRSKRRRKK